MINADAVLYLVSGLPVGAYDFRGFESLPHRLITRPRILRATRQPRNKSPRVDGTSPSLRRRSVYRESRFIHRRSGGALRRRHGSDVVDAGRAPDLLAVGAAPRRTGRPVVRSASARLIRDQRRSFGSHHGLRFDAQTIAACLRSIIAVV